MERALAAHPSVELAVYPELFLSGYELPGAPELAISADDEPLTRIRKAAAGVSTAVIIGFIERTESGAVANSAACIDADGSLAAVYRKTHLFGADEQRAFVPGEGLLVVELCGRRLAPLICFDIEFPELARAVARAGAELLVTIAANTEPYGPDHELATRARAHDNRRAHVYVNQVGRHRGMTFVGGSCVIASDAHTIVQAGSDEQLLEIELPLGSTMQPGEVDYLSQVRTDLPVRTSMSTA